MQSLPFVQVRDLPPSASFYSAVTQPLGLRYISADSSSITFGDTSTTPPLPVFEVKKVTGADHLAPFKPSRIVFSAPSPSVVSDFCAAAKRASPTSLISRGLGGSAERGNDPNFPGPHGAPSGGESESAQITDLEGNIMEVVYVNSPQDPSGYGGSTVRRTQSTTKEVSRILDWNLEVATQASGSVAGSAAVGGPAAGRGLEGEPFLLRRSVTTSTVEASPPQNPDGISASTVVGTVLGVAVGAAVGGALTYTMMRKDRSHAPHQVYDAPPTFQRRATFPDPYPDHRPKYVEVERTVERIHYPEQFPPSSRKYPPPSFMARYSQVDGPTRSRTLDEVDDRASRHTSRNTASRARGRSETGSKRQPLMIADHEYVSAVGSKHSNAPKLLVDAEHPSHGGTSLSRILDPQGLEYRGSCAASRASKALSKQYHHEPAPEHRSHASSHHTSSRHHRPPEAETYVSTRSKRSASTIRPAAPLVMAESMPLPVRSKAPSQYSSATVKPIRGVTSSRHSRVSARNVPLPPSTTGGWEDVPLGTGAADALDDVGSVAPSDSISCVGSKHSSRRHHRHHGPDGF
ncbi:hypothetical protein F4778DRAFT_775274 [Xylariomycetidae sp. FL2044]|nr:hypothetical protein F4778DRAFT_775274 [Xylariomycetidae sp. FL2044]